MQATYQVKVSFHEYLVTAELAFDAIKLAIKEHSRKELTLNEYDRISAKRIGEETLRAPTP